MENNNISKLQGIKIQLTSSEKKSEIGRKNKVKIHNLFQICRKNEITPLIRQDGVSGVVYVGKQCVSSYASMHKRRREGFA